MIFWAIFNSHAHQLLEISAAEMKDLRGHRTIITGNPVYWAEGCGVWPLPVAGVRVVCDVDPKTLKPPQ